MAQSRAPAMAGDRAQAERLAEAARRAVATRFDGKACRSGRFAVQESGNKTILDLTLHCPAIPGRLELEEHWGELFGPRYLSVATMDGGDRRVVSNRIHCIEKRFSGIGNQGGRICSPE